MTEAFDSWLSGQPNKKPQPKRGPYRCKVLRVAGNRVWVEMAGFSGRDFGPMPFGRTSTPPVAGDDGVITFLGAGISDPWLIAWSAPGNE